MLIDIIPQSLLGRYSNAITATYWGYRLRWEGYIELEGTIPSIVVDRNKCRVKCKAAALVFFYNKRHVLSILFHILTTLVENVV